LAGLSTLFVDNTYRALSEKKYSDYNLTAMAVCLIIKYACVMSFPQN